MCGRYNAGGMPEVNTFDERAEWRTCVSGNCVGNLERVAGNGRSSTLSGGKSVVGLQEMSPLQIAQSAFEKIYQVEMPEELTDLFQEAYLAATRKEEEE